MMRLILLPYAGGSFYAYRELENLLHSRIQCKGIDLPGHGRRMDEPLLTDIHEMVEDVLSQILPYLCTMPYAFYGHSMGATLGYLLTRRIETRKEIPLPVHLFFSGHAGPGTEADTPLHTLPRGEFIQALIEYGGLPDEVCRSNELLDLFLPILRADFQAIKDYTHDRDGSIHSPVTVMLGADDRLTRDKKLGWTDITTGKVTVRLFPGKHFFIHDRILEISRYILETLSV